MKIIVKGLSLICVAFVSFSALGVGIWSCANVCPINTPCYFNKKASNSSPTVCFQVKGRKSYKCTFFHDFTNHPAAHRFNRPTVNPNLYYGDEEITDTTKIGGHWLSNDDPVTKPDSKHPQSFKWVPPFTVQAQPKPRPHAKPKKYFLKAQEGISWTSSHPDFPNDYLQCKMVS